MAVDSVATMHSFVDTGYPSPEREQPADLHTRDHSIFYDVAVMKGIILGYEEHYGKPVTSRDQWFDYLRENKRRETSRRRGHEGDVSEMNCNGM
jgi:hypothetical protein